MYAYSNSLVYAYYIHHSTGMSAIKIVYATEEGDNLRFNFISFPNDDHDNAVKFLTKMHAGKLDPGTEVAVCGCGAERLKTKIDEALNIR